MNLQENINRIKEMMGVITEGKDPKTGTGKKPKSSDRRLYTDENPSDTVSVKFRTKEDIIDTLNKESFKSKPHNRQSQIINLIHQRVRAAYQNAKDPETKQRFKRAYDYIENVKEKSKEKTIRLQKEGLDDKWTDGEDTVTLKQLLKITKDSPVTKMLTKKLMKHALHGDNPEEMKKVDKSSLKYPVLVLVSDKGLIKYILDGHHRVQKANKHDIKMVNVKLIKFSELPKEFKKVLGGEKEEETEGVGAYAAPAFEMKPDHVHFKHLYNEQTESKKDVLKSMLQQSGWEVTSKLMGGIDNLINVLYDGDIMKFSEDTHTPLVYMSVDEMSLYIHVALVEKLRLENANFSSREKTLGKFRYGTKNGMQYAFTANLTPTRLHDQPYYKVVGTSGDSGFGYAFINKRNTLGKRYRQQIFKQIIDKYNLEPYMQFKTFY
jgi:hypothetical protein